MTGRFFFCVICNVGDAVLLCYFLCSISLVGCCFFLVICCCIWRVLDIFFWVGSPICCAILCVFFKALVFLFVLRSCVFWCATPRRKTHHKNTISPWLGGNQKIPAIDASVVPGAQVHPCRCATNTAQRACIGCRNRSWLVSENRWKPGNRRQISSVPSWTMA